MNTVTNDYDEFEQKMIEKYPEILGVEFGGFCINKGWWPVVEALCSNIQNHIDHRNEQYNTYKRGEPVQQVVALQIKEKFGGLRFYYTGGDDTIRGMVYMAEAWANRVCEDCGAPSTKKTTGWIKTVCDEHYKKYMSRFDEDTKE